MTIASEIQRLQEAKQDILESIRNKGVDVPDTTTLSETSALIDAISGGGVDEFNVERWLVKYPEIYSYVQIAPSYSSGLFMDTNTDTKYRMVMIPTYNFSFDEMKTSNGNSGFAFLSTIDVKVGDNYNDECYGFHPVVNDSCIVEPKNNPSVAYFGNPDSIPKAVWFRLKNGASLDRNKRTLKIMTWNIGHFSNGVSSDSSITSSNYESKKSGYIDFINTVSPDFLCVNEMSNVFASNINGQTRYAKSDIFNDYDIVGSTSQLRYVQNTVFSRKTSAYSYGEEISFDCNKPPKSITHTTAIRIYDYRCLKFYTWIQGKKILVVSLHLGFDNNNTQINKDQINELIEKYRDEQYVILLGKPF